MTGSTSDTPATPAGRPAAGDSSSSSSDADRTAAAARNAAGDEKGAVPAKAGATAAASPRKPAKKEPERQMTVMEEVWDIARTVLIAVAVTLFVRFFFYQPFNIPSGSMKPTLLVGDFILVDKIDYGYSRASLIWPLTRAPLDGRLFSDAPDRGEIVVFKNAADRNKDYIKRVIGVPGDTVQMRSGALYINDIRVQREELAHVPPQCGPKSMAPPANARTYRETLPNNVSYVVQECGGNATDYDSTPSFTVPEGYYFLMGDNRDNSQDSRTTGVGYKEPLNCDVARGECDVFVSHYVPLDQIVGKATRVAFSVDGEDARIWQIWRWPFAIRYGRLFDRVE